jgi:predicted HTH transcriptional regulator
MKTSYLEEVTKQWESRQIAAEEELRAAQEAAEQMKMEAEEAEKRAQDARRALEEIDRNQGKTSDEKVYHIVDLNDQSVSVKYVRKIITTLKNQHMIERVGSNKTGYWKIHTNSQI